jgi:hypothetical protein
MTCRLLTVALLGAGCNGSLAYYGKESTTPGPDGTSPAPVGGETPLESSDTTSLPTGTSTTPTDPTTTGTTAVDSGTGPVGWVNGDPGAPPPYSATPANELVGDCVTVGLVADLDVDSVDVKSHDDNLEVRTIESPVSGWYELYDRTMAREGSGEWNESGMVRVSNATVWLGLPVLSNCEDDWVAVDADNYGDPGDTLFYLGTFWFDAGDNVVELEHVCPRIRAGSCTELEFLDDDDTTCEADDGNSAHLWRDSLCLVAPTP